MKRTLIFLALIASSAASAEPWTYRGALNDGGKPANGQYDLRLTLINEAGTASVSEPITLYRVAVKDGNFATEVDFGFDLTRAPALKLKTEVQHNGSGFSSLGEPTRFDPKAALAVGACWSSTGDSGTNPAINFLGTTDLQPLNIATNGSVSMYLEPSSILFGGSSITSNVVGGSNQNRASSGVRGAAIAGGGVRSGDSDPDFTGEAGNRVSDHYGFIGGGFNNVAGNLTGTLADAAFAVVGGGSGNAAGKNAVIGGGRDNVAAGFASVVSGGFDNGAAGEASVIGGGQGNFSSATQATIGGGIANIASGGNSTVSGGIGNNATGFSSTVSGGQANCAGGNNSWAGGVRAKVRPGSEAGVGTCAPSSGDSDGDNGTFVWADDQGTDFISTGPRQFAIRAQGGLRWGGTGIASTTSPAFTQIVNTANNTCDGGSGVANSRMIVTHPLLNDNPNAVVLFSANFGTLTAGGGAPPRNPLAIYYNDVINGTCPRGRWIIYQTSVTAEVLNNNSRYNIWFVLP